MKNGKRFMMLLTIVMGIAFMMGQNKVVKSTVVFTGEILKKPWTKSEQSFCAMGSDYYVLKVITDNEEKGGAKNQRPREYVLDNSSQKSGIDLEEYLGKFVLVRGQIIQRKIEMQQDDQEQRPVNAYALDEAFTCEVFRIQKIQVPGD